MFGGPIIVVGEGLRSALLRWLRASLQPVTLLGLMMIAACWLALAYILAIERSKSVEGAVHQGANLARLFEENTISTLAGVDRAMLLLREAYERDPAHFDLRDWSKRTALIGDLTIQIGVVGPDGFATNKTTLILGPDWVPVDVSDREYYTAQRDASTDQLFIGKPIMGRGSGVLSFQLSRRLRNPDGSFAGVLVASIDPNFVERFFKAVDLGPQGSVLLRSLDGVIMASRGLSGATVGRRVMQSGLRAALARGAAGTYWGAGAVDGVNRLVSYRVADNFPLMVMVGLAEDHIFESYLRNRATYVTIASIVTLLVLLAIALGIRHHLRLDRIRDDLRRSEAQARQQARELELKTRELEVTLDHMGQGIVMTDADNHVPVINRKAVELLGLPTSFHRGGDGAMLGPEARDLLMVDTPVPENPVYQRMTASGIVLEVHHTPLPDGGAVRTITDITERKRAEQEIVRLAHHDALTGLANRNLLHGRIEQAISRAKRHGEGFAVLCVDLDRFKTVNDSLGHSVGDELLRQLAERLRRCARDIDTVARVGGDEFVVLQTRANRMDDAAALARRIQQCVGEPYRVAGSQMTIGVSIGIALAPQDGMGVDQLLGNADLALYRAKAAGRNTFCFFSADIEKAAFERYRLERELPRALERNEFELFYQPWVTFADGAFSGCEALLRWRHPERGIIAPAEFIAIAEDIGMIGRLGDWVMRRACHDAAGWPQPVKVAVNLSAAQFMTGDLLGTVMEALAASGLPPRRLELEITETLLLDDYEGTLATLHRLRDRGVSIALDDFGTGYSSLTYLRQFPFDRIKIDQTFVAEMTTRADCAAIVMAVAGLGRSLGVDITAEGIELQDQLMMLQAAGCTDGQGYLICRPQPANRIAEVLSGRSAVTSIAS
jgi:diguanylate cyclase (GGDEF)-like protein